MPEIKTVIITPYVTRDYLVEKGYGDDALADGQILESPKINNILYIPNFDSPDFYDEIDKLILENPNILVAGQTSVGERMTKKFVKNVKGIVAIRYSYFHGISKDDPLYSETGGYTGTPMSVTGYALSCSKNIEQLRSLLSDEDILYAIYQKNREDLRKAVIEFNKKFKNPITFTEYFEKLFL